MSTQPNVTGVNEPVAPTNNAAIVAAWTSPDGFIFRPGATFVDGGPVSGNVYNTVGLDLLMSICSGADGMKGGNVNVYFDFSLVGDTLTLTNTPLNFGAHVTIIGVFNYFTNTYPTLVTVGTTGLAGSTQQLTVKNMILDLEVTGYFWNPGTSIGSGLLENVTILEGRYCVLAGPAVVKLTDKTSTVASGGISKTFTATTSDIVSIQLDEGCSLGPNACQASGGTVFVEPFGNAFVDVSNAAFLSVNDSNGSCSMNLGGDSPTAAGVTDALPGFCITDSDTGRQWVAQGQDNNAPRVWGGVSSTVVYCSGNGFDGPESFNTLSDLSAYLAGHVHADISFNVPTCGSVILDPGAFPMPASMTWTGVYTRGGFGPPVIQFGDGVNLINDTTFHCNGVESALRGRITFRDLGFIVANINAAPFTSPSKITVYEASGAFSCTTLGDGTGIPLINGAEELISKDDATFSDIADNDVLLIDVTNIYAYNRSTFGDGSVDVATGSSVIHVEDSTVSIGRLLTVRAGLTIGTPMANLIDATEDPNDFGWTPANLDPGSEWVSPTGNYWQWDSVGEIWVPKSGLFPIAANLSLTDLQAAGAVTTASYTIGTFPANARWIRAEIAVNNGLAEAGLLTAHASLGSPGGPGDMISSVTVKGGLFRLLSDGGDNPYQSRGGEDIDLTIVITGDGGQTLAGLTGGDITVRLYYAVMEVAL